MKKILLIDDEEDILDITQYNLEQEGFEVKTAGDGVQGLAIAKEFIPDLILLDVMMPNMDGMETCQELRKVDSLSNTLICFLTARGEDYSQIAGYDAGGDDYVVKPIKPKVLVSKLKALLKRKESFKPEAVASKSVSGDIEIDRDQYLVKIKGSEMSLPKKEFELLALLVSNAGNVLRREVILKEVWGQEIVVGDRTIDVHIRKIREKIGDQYIKTIKGVGYKLINE